jgi:chemotaxis protein CheX
MTGKPPSSELVLKFFGEATVRTLQTMCQISFEPERISRDEVKEGSWGDITGLIGLASDSFKGTFTISFEKKTALAAVTNMFGEPVTELQGEVSDAVGEMTNIITGGAKADISREGIVFTMASPTIIIGHEVIFSQKKLKELYHQLLVSPLGNIRITVGAE